MSCFFYCTLPEINCSPFTVGREVVFSFDQRGEGGGVDGRESWEGRCRRKRSGLLQIVALSAGVKSSHCGSTQEGKQKFRDTEQGEGERERKRGRERHLQTTVSPR